MDGHATGPFEGDLVRLRALEREDLPHLNPLFDDPEVLAGLASVTFPQSMAGITEWFEGSRTKEDGVRVVIEVKDGGEAIGVCSLEGVNGRDRLAEFGIWIGRPFWGKGYGTDATRTICRFGFRHMNLHRVTLHVVASNAKAVRAYEKAGFIHEGRLREAHFLGGLPVDILVMGLLEDELDRPA
jgi:RimJ/RimL family protein N-acetyltransferase